ETRFHATALDLPSVHKMRIMASKFLSRFRPLNCPFKKHPMEDLQKTLTTYAYNITGSLEDARDVVQDVIEKHIGMDLSHIENEKNYLIKSTINRAITLKKKKTMNPPMENGFPNRLRSKLRTAP